MNKETQNRIDEEFIRNENKYRIHYAKLKDVSQEILYNFKCELHLDQLLLGCSMRNNYDLAKKLIEWGANVNSQVLLANTPLQSACQNNSYECVELLIKHDSDVNHKNIFEDTALTIAKENQVNQKIIDLLIQNGAHE